MIEDVDEPPVFSALIYEWKVPENAVVGTQVGTVNARDIDAANNPIKWVKQKYVGFFSMLNDNQDLCFTDLFCFMVRKAFAWEVLGEEQWKVEVENLFTIWYRIHL